MLKCTEGTIELVMILEVYRLDSSQYREQVGFEGGLLVFVVKNANVLVKVVCLRFGLPKRKYNRLVWQEAEKVEDEGNVDPDLHLRYFL